MATRAVNKTAKEGEQNARLLLSRGALSAMAIFRRAAFPSVRRWRCTAPYRLLAPAAPALCLSCFWRGRSPSPAFGAVFFAGRAAVIWCGANPGVRPWQDLHECVLGRLAVAIFSRGAFLGSPMTKCSRNAFPSVRQWQDCALMRSWPDWQRQYSRAMSPQVPCRGKISPRCVPGRQSVASFALHASQKWSRTGKSPVRGKIRAPCIRNAPQTAVWEYTARRSCQEGVPFAARAPRITHGAQILPSVVAPNRPSARNPGAAEQREPPELDRPAQETQPGGSAPVASWAASTASSSLGTATALCQHQPVACRPANNSVIADSVTCGDSIHAAPAPPIRRAALAQREGYLPYLWRLSSVFLADAIGL